MAQGATFFRMLNIVTAMLFILGGVLLFVRNDAWNSSITGVYICAAGCLIFFLEFMIPEVLVYNLGFLFSMLGRGLCDAHSFVINIGSICLAHKWFNIVVGCIIMLIGLVYIAMHFFGATPSPSMSAIPNPAGAEIASDYDETRYVNGGETYEPNMAQNYQSPAIGTDYGATMPSMPAKNQ
ncbi:Late Golgi vesicles protein [Entomortierella beljakovae]|nr:Late Golgi vesicles protein [Entomortierella beljakovae]